MSITRKAFEWGPLLFGIGFIAPLVAQSLEAAGVAAPLGLGETQFGLAVGAAMGTVAKLRGRWV